MLCLFTTIVSVCVQSFSLRGQCLLQLEAALVDEALVVVVVVNVRASCVASLVAEREREGEREGEQISMKKEGLETAD